MTGRPLSPEERKVFDRWAIAVAAFYSAVLVGLLLAFSIFPTATGIEKASLPVGDLASGRLISGDRRP